MVRTETSTNPITFLFLRAVRSKEPKLEETHETPWSLAVNSSRNTVSVRIERRDPVNKMAALAETPKCKATQEALLREDSNLRLRDECSSCNLLGVRCLIASHPSSTGMS